jgi:hypothetical protein
VLAEELAARFGTKLRQIEPVRQVLPTAMSDLLRVIEQAEEPHPAEKESSPRSDSEKTPGK